MDHSDRETLIDDLLAAGPSDAVRASWEKQTLRLVRRRRRERHSIRAAAVAMTILVLANLSRHFFPHAAASAGLPPASSASPLPYTLVRSSPLPAEAIIETRPTTPAALIVSDQFAGMISTRGGGYRLLADGELLKLVSPRSGMLVRSGTAERLVFPDPGDVSGFPLN